MKNSLVLPLALATGLTAAPAFAQGSGRDVQVFRMGGPQLGVRLAEVDQDVVSRLKLKEEKGALVTEVVKDSAAAKAGIVADDVILRFHGESILTAAQLGRLVRDVPEGRKVDIDLVRGGAPVKVTATMERATWSGDKLDFPELKDLGERLGKGLGKSGTFPHAFNFKFDEGGPAWMTLRAGRGRLGITYTEIEGQLAEYFKAKGETAILVNSVVKDSAAEKAGLKAGDVLVKIADTSIENGSDLADAVRDLETGTSTPISVLRDGRTLDLSVTLEAPKRAETRPRGRVR